MDVLIVDDEAMLRETVSENLTDDGLKVSSAGSAEAALEIAGLSGMPDVVVTDVDLGTGMDGFVLAQEVHRRWPSVGVVIMTGNPANFAARRTGENERFLEKPFGPARLVAAVRDLMGRSGQ